jgi:hypothetical protein
MRMKLGMSRPEKQQLQLEYNFATNYKGHICTTGSGKGRISSSIAIDPRSGAVIMKAVIQGSQQVNCFTLIDSKGHQSGMEKNLFFYSLSNEKWKSVHFLN